MCTKKLHSIYFIHKQALPFENTLCSDDE